MHKSVAHVDGSDTSISHVFGVARYLDRVEISADCLQKVAEVNSFYSKLRREQIIYGDTTGFGERVGHYVSRDKDKEKNRNLVYSLNCGSGPFLRNDQVRTAIFARILVLSKACSGVRPEILTELADILNKNRVPKVPSIGSIGASGDLIPSSYIAGEILEKMDLEGREGLALLNGTHFMSGISALVCMDFSYLFMKFCELVAILFQCLEGIENVFDREFHFVKKHTEEAEIAGTFRMYLEGSNLLRNIEELVGLNEETLKTIKPIQDRYSLRCLPQALGPVLRQLNESFVVVSNELNSVSDNPIIVCDAIKHGGHFDGSYIAHTMNCLKLSIREVAYITRAYIRNVTDAKLNRGLLPTYLVHNNDAVQNGLQGLAGLETDAVFVTLNENAIADSIFAMNDHEAENQNIVSLGTHTALSASRMVEHLSTMVAILAIVTRQAVELRGVEKELSPITQEIYSRLKKVIPFIKTDRSLHDDLRRLEKLFFHHKL